MCLQIANKNKETRKRDVGMLLGPKLLPLGEENLHKILLRVIPIDEYQDHNPWRARPLQDKDTNPLLAVRSSSLLQHWSHLYCITEIVTKAITSSLSRSLLRLWPEDHDWDHDHRHPKRLLIQSVTLLYICRVSDYVSFMCWDLRCFLHVLRSSLL